MHSNGGIQVVDVIPGDSQLEKGNGQGFYGTHKVAPEFELLEELSQAEDAANGQQLDCFVKDGVVLERYTFLSNLDYNLDKGEPCNHLKWDL